MSLFKAYDVRGVYPKEFDEEDAYRIGYAYAKSLRSKNILVGRDSRLSSPSLAKAFISGARDYGSTVVDIGVCTTPMLYFACKDMDGAMITASHNPKEYNGIKFVRKGGAPIGSNTGLDDIRALSQKEIKKKQRGKLKKKSITSVYVKHVCSFAKNIDPSLSLVIDTGNGSEGVIMPEIIKKLRLKKVKKLNFKPDGRFPNRPPNPLHAKSMSAARKAVRERKADIGVLYDADGDRLIVLDEKGKHIRADHVLILLAKHLVKKGQKVVHDLRASWTVREEIKRLGAESEQSKVGRTNIYELMKENKAVLGGELSGHYFFKANKYADNADIALIHLLSFLSSQDMPLSHLVRPIDRYASSGEINFSVTHRQKVITHVYNFVREKFRGAKIQFLDGLSVELKDWWFNLRPSNTQPVVRLVVEARNEKLLEKRVRMLKKHIKE